MDVVLPAAVWATMWPSSVCGLQVELVDVSGRVIIRLSQDVTERTQR